MPLGTLYRNLTTLSAFNIFVAWIKIFKYLSFNKTMIQLSGTLSAVITFSKYNVYQCIYYIFKNSFLVNKRFIWIFCDVFHHLLCFCSTWILVVWYSSKLLFVQSTYFHYFYYISFIYFSRFMTLEALPILYILCSG